MKEYNGEAYQELINQKGLVLIDFFATWCGPCQMITPILEDISKNSDVPITKLDIDKFKPIAEENNIKSVPTLVLYKDGKEIARRSGFQPKDGILKWFADNK